MVLVNRIALTVSPLCRLPFMPAIIIRMRKRRDVIGHLKIGLYAIFTERSRPIPDRLYVGYSL